MKYELEKQQIKNQVIELNMHVVVCRETVLLWAKAGIGIKALEVMKRTHRHFVGQEGDASTQGATVFHVGRTHEKVSVRRRGGLFVAGGLSMSSPQSRSLSKDAVGKFWSAVRPAFLELKA